MPVVLTEEQIAEFKSVFNKFDENKDNTISFKELKNVFSDIGLDFSDEESIKIVNIMNYSSFYLLIIY
jgi:Ca2+-binding EF-hand superfamily protein